MVRALAAHERDSGSVVGALAAQASLKLIPILPLLMQSPLMSSQNTMHTESYTHYSTFSSNETIPPLRELLHVHKY